MKKYLYRLQVILLLGLIGCSDGDDEANKYSGYRSANTDTFVINVNLPTKFNIIKYDLNGKAVMASFYSDRSSFVISRVGNQMIGNSSEGKLFEIHCEKFVEFGISGSGGKLIESSVVLYWSDTSAVADVKDSFENLGAFPTPSMIEHNGRESGHSIFAVIAAN